MTTRELFLQALQEALYHLYDPDRLRHSPLAERFGVAGRSDTPTLLQRILLEAIEALKPKTHIPPGARAWRIYDLLSCSFVQQLGQRVAAGQLGISPRHLRRERQVALEALAYQLAEQFQFNLDAPEPAGMPEAITPPSADETARPEPPSGLADELKWLREAPRGTCTDLAEELPTVLQLARGLAAQHGVELAVDLDPNLPRVAAHPVALSQALLNLLTVALHRARGGQVTFEARNQRWEVVLRIAGARPVHARANPGEAPSVTDDAASVEQAHQLAALCGGQLSLLEDAQTIEVTLTLFALGRLPVLVIDDNADTLQLLERYVSGTRYALIGAQEPDAALELAARDAPQVIVLDVMMPQVDGWRLLGRLRQEPRTACIPVIVCTILAQEELALHLGASGFIRKPVTRQTFLDALDLQTAAAPASPVSAKESG